MADLISAVFYGALSGIGWSLTGYAGKKTKDNKTAFAPLELAKTTIIGAILGGYAGLTGIPVDLASTTYLYPVTAIVEQILSIFYRTGKKTVNKVLK